MRRICYPSVTAAARDIIEAGRRLYLRGLVAAGDGNISSRVGKNRVLCTPSGVSKGFMTREMLVITDLAGRRVAGTRPPSSEIKMHLAIYRANPRLLGVVHAHPPAAAAFAAAGKPLDQALLQETVVQLGVIPVAGYAAPGSQELAAGAAAFARGYNGVLLEHHGAAAWGEGVLQALFRMESIEHTAQVYMNSAVMGLTRPMTQAQIDGLMPLRRSLGVAGGGRPKGRQE